MEHLRSRAGRAVRHASASVAGVVAIVTWL